MEVFEGDPEEDEGTGGEVGVDGPADAGGELEGDAHEGRVEGDGEDAGGGVEHGFAETGGTEGCEGKPVAADEVPEEEDGVGVAVELGVAGDDFAAVGEDFLEAGGGSPEELELEELEEFELELDELLDGSLSPSPPLAA